jgi:hypothetical protein
MVGKSFFVTSSSARVTYAEFQVALTVVTTLWGHLRDWEIREEQAAFFVTRQSINLVHKVGFSKISLTCAT